VNDGDADGFEAAVLDHMRRVHALNPRGVAR
jgi:hypothetical protein